MRIFMTSYLYEPRIRAGMGGFQKVFELADQFSRSHHVTLFLPAYSRQPSDLDCVWIPVVNRPLLRLLSFNLMLALALAARALRGRPDVIYQRVFNAFSPPLLARLLGATYVVELNGNPLEFYGSRSRSLGNWVRRLVSWNLRRADSIVALTEGLKSAVRSDFGVDNSNTLVAPSGSNPELFYPRERSHCRRELGIAGDALLAVFAGTFFAYQGIDLLLEAVKDSGLADLQVWLLGEGVMRAQWEARASALGLNHVRFTGQVEYARVPLFIGAADFCLAPFQSGRGEVSPLKVLDYLFCARPTVIARIPAVENLIGSFHSLLPFTAGEPRSLAKGLRTMAQQRDHFSTLALADSVRARREYSWERIAGKIAAACFPGCAATGGSQSQGIGSRGSTSGY
ncbi:MAG: glycosyltransferase family 4 protein [Acidobacteria bacterium]|nr:glycosyltransferase family 4 protein [Acidobacteriota bacterium]